MDDPKAVLEIVKAGPPALIVTNVSLPGITGPRYRTDLLVPVRSGKIRVCS